MPVASTSFDLVVGLDTHIELVPTPAPTPTPFPHPHCSVIWDPLAPLVAEVTGMLRPSAPSPVGSVLIGGRAATVAGDTARMIVSHVVIPPGTAFATGVTPSDAELLVGSQSVVVRGRAAVRAGEVAMSCSEPTRLPSSQVVSTAAGPNITMIGGPAAPATAVAAAVLDARPPRNRWSPSDARDVLAKVMPVKWERLRRLMPNGACFFTGHPVNVATGTVSTAACDVELHGAVPLRFAREYDSNWAARDSPVGFGWSHSLDQRVWSEPGRVVVLLDDGRELEYSTGEFAGQAMRRGDALWHPVDRSTLHAKGALEWELHGVDGDVRVFAPIAGERASNAARGMSRLVAIRRHGRDAVTFYYDEHARLEQIAGGGRVLQLQYDDEGHVRRLLAPSGAADELVVHAEFEYANGDLVVVKDALGQAWQFEYDGHLLVREQDRNGLGFYFQYDGRGPRARCVRTWGDGGIYDHVIAYDRRGRATFVTNSLGEATTYSTNELGLVVQITQPDGTTKAREYADTTWLTAEIDELGHATRYSYDERGNLVGVVQPDGATTTARYEHDRLVEQIDAIGATWRFTHDRFGRVRALVDPLGHSSSYVYEDGTLRAIVGPDGATTSFSWDRADNLVGRTTPDGRTTTWERDACGRVVVASTTSGAVVRQAYDALGRLVEVLESDAARWQIERDPEGKPVRVAGPTSEIELRYVGRGWLAAYEFGGETVEFRYDTEGQLLAVIDEAGRSHTFERAPSGHLRAEVTIDGKRTTHVRDAAGRVRATVFPDGTRSAFERDPMGRCTRVTAAASTEATYAYDPRGRLTEARNEHARVRFEYDALGRLIEERCEPADSRREVVISCRWDHLDQRVGVRSSLGADLVFTPDVAGDIVRVEQRRGLMHAWTAELRYDTEGSELERILPGGARSTWSRDPLGPARHTVLGGDQRRVRERVYRWTPGGRLRGIAEQEREVTYEFDGRDALTCAVLPDETVVGRFPDRRGRIFATPDRDDREYGAAGEVVHTRTGRDVVGFEYDDRGRLVRKLARDGAWRFQWDGFDRMTRVDRPDASTVTMTYDALGRRLSKSHAGARTDFTWDGDVLLHERTQDRVITWVFEPGSFAPLARITEGDAHCVVSDHVGSPLVVLDEQGHCAAAYTGDVLGRVEVVGDPELCPFRFAGQYADTEIGLHYNRFRYYDPATGQYTSRDPLGVRAGLRAYAYVDDPSTWSDPLGLTTVMGAGESCSGGASSVELLAPERREVVAGLLPPLLRWRALPPLSLVDPRLGLERTAAGRVGPWSAAQPMAGRRAPEHAAFVSQPPTGAPLGLDGSPSRSRR